MQQAFELSRVIDQRRRSGKAWLEFLRVPALSLGIYSLPARGEDPQNPHTEDEVYYVVSGRAMLRVGDEDRVVEPGAILFVGANVKHRFHSIKEDLTTLVFFAPVEGSTAGKK
jgi:mannose-6-phosphate isomerase-like protein (cupin superfamily)